MDQHTYPSGERTLRCMVAWGHGKGVPTMAQARDAGKQQHWLELLRRWQQSRLTVRAFCNRHGVSEPNFYAWRRLLRQRGLLQPKAALPPPSRLTPPTPAFVKVSVTAESQAASAVELVLSERRLLRVSPGFDPDTLLQLVRLLEEPAC